MIITFEKKGCVSKRGYKKCLLSVKQERERRNLDTKKNSRPHYQPPNHITIQQMTLLLSRKQPMPQYNQIFYGPACLQQQKEGLLWAEAAPHRFCYLLWSTAKYVVEIRERRLVPTQYVMTFPGRVLNCFGLF